MVLIEGLLHGYVVDEYCLVQPLMLVCVEYISVPGVHNECPGFNHCWLPFSIQHASSGYMCSCGASPAAVWLPLVNGSMCTCIQHNILPLVNNGSMYVHVCNTIYMLCSKPVYISQPLTCTVICCIPKRAIDLELYNMFSPG